MKNEEIEWGIGLWPVELKRKVPFLVSRGLLAVGFCEFGLGRSPDMAQTLMMCGLKSIYLARGLFGLNELNKSQQDEAITFLKKIHYRYVDLSDDGMRKYEFLISKIDCQKWIPPQNVWE
jgi:hypothetical protein